MRSAPPTVRPSPASADQVSKRRTIFEVFNSRITITIISGIVKSYSAKMSNSQANDASRDEMCVDDDISRDETCMDETSVGAEEDEAPGIKNVTNVDDAFFEVQKGAEKHLKSPAYRLLINPRNVTQKKLVTPKTVIRFFLERGIFFASIIEFKRSRRPLEKFSGRARHMLGFPHVRAMLDQAQVTRAIQDSGDLFIFHDARGTVALLARWCIPTHTFIYRWGEFTITLEDVVALMHLPITGNLPGDLSDEETAVEEVKDAMLTGGSE